MGPTSPKWGSGLQKLKSGISASKTYYINKYMYTYKIHTHTLRYTYIHIYICIIAGSTKLRRRVWCMARPGALTWMKGGWDHGDGVFLRNLMETMYSKSTA